jgi:hypothetical protein
MHERTPGNNRSEPKVKPQREKSNSAKPKETTFKPSDAREPFYFKTEREKDTSPALQTLVNAVMTRIDGYEAHGGCVDLVFALSAFNKEDGPITEDRMIPYGPKSILEEFHAGRINRKLAQEKGEEPYLDCEYWHTEEESEVIN